MAGVNGNASRRALLALAVALAVPRPARPAAGGTGRVIEVGPQRPLRRLSDALKQAVDGDTILLDPGEYAADTGVVRQNGLTISGQGAHLQAQGAHAEGKGILVVRARDVGIDGLRFTGARVPSRNGAGIRLEAGSLRLKRCTFDDNENGILTANSSDIELDVVDCSFRDNGAGDGYTHNLYAGTIARLHVSGSYFTRARRGHLLKSRAQRSEVLYSRLSGEDGSSSYELEFPSGGSALVAGNLIQQGQGSDNGSIVAVGAERYHWPRNEITMAFNTVVNDRSQGGLLVRIKAGPVGGSIAHNLWLGRGSLDLPQGVLETHNRTAARDDFADADALDLRLRIKSPLAGSAGNWGALRGESFLPRQEYVHPAGTRPLQGYSTLTPVSPGAFQLLA